MKMHKIFCHNLWYIVHLIDLSTTCFAYVSDAEKFAPHDLSEWDVSRVEIMDSMFKG